MLKNSYYTNAFYVHIKNQWRVGIKGSGLLNHESIYWSHDPRIHKTSIFDKSFSLKYGNIKKISAGDICLSICIGLN